MYLFTNVLGFRTSSCYDVPFWLKLAFTSGCLFVFTLPPTPYYRGNVLLLYLYCLQLIAFPSFFDVASTLAFTAACFTSSEFNLLSWRYSNQFEYPSSPLAFSTLCQFKCWTVSLRIQPGWLLPGRFPSDGGTCDHQMLYSKVWTTNPKTCFDQT